MAKCLLPSEIGKGATWGSLIGELYGVRIELQNCATWHNLLVDQIKDRLNAKTP